MLYSHSRFSCELSEIGAAKPDGARLSREAPAALGRLCVETPMPVMVFRRLRPAALGRLCVETKNHHCRYKIRKRQPPSGGCVLKHEKTFFDKYGVRQPPSGGCVLKHVCKYAQDKYACPAALGRLCVETFPPPCIPPSGVPAALGRLCVETACTGADSPNIEASRPRAAVC